MKEIEILVKVLEPKDKALKKLKKLKFKTKKQIKDIYFTNPKFKKETLRLRKKGNKSYLTYKKDHYKKGIWIYSDEFETEINNFEETQKILLSLGFKKLTELDINVQTFITDKYEIDLEDVKNLGLFLEVECLKTSKDVKKLKKEIWSFIESLNIKTTKELNYGKPELMLKHNNP